MPRPNVTPKTVFASHLRALRIAAGYETAHQFAKAIGKEKETYNRWERGETEPSVTDLAKISEALDVSTDFIIKGPRRPGPSKNVA